MAIRVRIAPSPTGSIHVGTARTALFNWLFAKKHGGEFILRIEDTDLERSEKKYEEDIIRGLSWLGITWDGPIYRQTERGETYRAYLSKLLAEGKAFWCYHTKEELDEERSTQQEKKEAPRHVCAHKQNPPHPTSETGGIIRLAVDAHSTRTIVFRDLIRGDIEWKEASIGDLSLAKNLDTPLYNFAVVVDDATMEISHVIRGEDHISNTPKQILIYEAIGKPLPAFAHLPLILAPDRSKLSKRHGAVSLNEYRDDYLPEALVNFMGSLGYTYSREVLSKEEMAREFTLENIHASGAVFNLEKLDWFNAQYVKNLTPTQLRDATHSPDIPDAAVPFVNQRLERLSHIHNFSFFWERPTYATGLLKWKGMTDHELRDALQSVREVIATHKEGSPDRLRELLDALATGRGGRGAVYWPLRVALSGRDASPDPVEILGVVGISEALFRIDTALEKIGT